MYGIGARKTFAAPNILKELNFKVSCSFLLLPNCWAFFFHVVLRVACLLLFPFSGYSDNFIVPFANFWSCSNLWTTIVASVVLLNASFISAWQVVDWGFSGYVSPGWGGYTEQWCYNQGYGGMHVFSGNQLYEYWYTPEKWSFANLASAVVKRPLFILGSFLQTLYLW